MAQVIYRQTGGAQLEVLASVLLSGIDDNVYYGDITGTPISTNFSPSSSGLAITFGSDFRTLRV
ncbi:hypothetical protein BM1_02213 [Bipolaris maydis]|nr:hypothetical protein BM1_02213 [Bipolaris maydis]